MTELTIRVGMRAKRGIPAQALTGRFTDHHAFLARTMTDRIDAITATGARLSQEITRQLAPFRRQVELLTTVPGVSTKSAEVILAEIGVDMTRFPSAAHLASWAGMCPGNYESAGKHTSGKSRPGDPWLKGALGLAATAAARSKNTYLAARYKRIAVRRGKKRAMVAVGHTILTSTWHMLTRDTDYHGLGGDYFIQRTGRTRQT
ncbi:transposase [Streptomyces sp. NPDC127051]|uniref:transposase n=1 Tax=Streptomyces sp. NPDC127051 TaxID=3347119 RepID=UPI00364CC821